MLSTHQTAVAQTEVAVVNGDQHKHASRRTATSDRKSAVIVGVLFITATVANLLSTSLTRSLVTAPDYLRSLSASGNHVLVGALLALIAALASASIAMALYPVLRHYNEGLALGSVGFRLIEAVFYLVDIVGLLSLLALSQAFVKAGAPGDPYFQTISTLIQAAREWVNFVLAVSAFSLGALLYYVVIYQSKLIPRWLAGWGVLGAACSLGAAITMLFGLAPYSLPMLVLVLPIAVQEMVLAIWLIVRGFNPSAIASSGHAE
jgi:Domain of unknown function (DUF4386)